jgi:hypothetical protein
MKHNAPHKYPWEDPEIPNLDKEEPTSDLDDLDDEELDPIVYVGLEQALEYSFSSTWVI